MSEYSEPFAEQEGFFEVHSALGLSSLILSGLTCLTYCGLFVLYIVVIMGSIDQLQTYDPYGSSFAGMEGLTLMACAVGLCALGSPVISLVGLGLGIAGLLQQDREKLFSILGVAVSALLLIGSCSLLLLGLFSSLGAMFLTTPYPYY